ncbi:MAG: sigma-70 family RNA polymerase sigma factor [Planctomycetota bacterium]
MSIELEEVSGQLDWLQALAVSIVADQQAAEDLVQHALQAATSKMDWQPGRLKPWLVGTVRNMARQYFRTESRRRQREQRVVAAAEDRARVVRGGSSTALPEELAEQVESQKLLSSAVLDLQEPYRETILLFYYGNQTQQQIADAQNVSVRTVETRLRRARKSIRGRLVSQYGKESWAFALLPLLKRLPPPQMLPPISVAGPGSLGGGWWAIAGLTLAVGGWSWLAQGAEPLSHQPLVNLTESAPAHEIGAKSDVSRSLLVAENDEGETAGKADLLDSQEFVFEERGTGVGLGGLRLRLLFLRPANSEQRLHVEDPQFFQPKDRIWWKLGEAVQVSDADGRVRFELPAAATHLMLDLNVHSPTHSLAGYSQQFKAFPHVKIAGYPLPLEMVRRTGVASGYVLDQGDNPLADVLVDVFFDAPQKLSANPVITIPTEADGSFRIPNIACDQGGFRLRPRGIGYASLRSLRMQRYAGFGVDYPGISLLLVDGSQSTQVEVKNEEGLPLPGVRVEATMPKLREADLSFEFGTYLNGWSASGVTNENGIALLQGIPTGEILWSAHHPNYLPTSQLESMAHASLGLTLHPGHTEHFEVRNALGPVQGAVIGMYSKSTRRTAVTDAEGKATLLGLPTDELMHSTVSHPDFALWQQSSTAFLAGEHVTTVSMQAGHSISGKVEWNAQAPGLQGERPRVFIRPLSASPLIAFPVSANQRPDSGWWQVVGLDETTVDEDGSFSFVGLPDTEVELWFGLRRRPLGFAQAHSGDSDVLLSFASGMADKASIDVHVFDELSGRPVTTHYLFWTNLDGDQPITLPAVIVNDADGRYRHFGLEPGLWTLTAWAPQGFTTRRLNPRRIGPGPQAIEIPLAAARSLRLRFVDSFGWPLEGVEVSALAQDGGVLLQGGLLGGGFRTWSSTNAQGQVAMSHIPKTQPYDLSCKYQGRNYRFAMPGAQVEGALHELILPISKDD